MRSRQLLLGGLLLLLACNGGPAAAVPPPSPSTIHSTPPQLVLRSPAEDILSDGDVALARHGGADHLGLPQAAEQEENQPLALVTYRSWGWVEEATRSWGDSRRGVREALLLLTREDGARLAYRSFAAAFDAAPFQRTGCPPTIAADDCAEASGGGSAAIAARVGRYAFRMEGTGVDLERLAALQAERIRRPAR